MQDFVEPDRSARGTRSYAGQGMTALLLAALLVPAPGGIAIAAIAAAGLIVMGAQHVILRCLMTRSEELIGTQEALVAGAATWRQHPEALFGPAGIEARHARRDGIRSGKVLTWRGGGTQADGGRLAA